MPPAKSATISLDQGWRLLRGVLAICDKQELFCHILREHGFSAFDPLLANYFTYVLPVEIEATQKRMAEETKDRVISFIIVLIIVIFILVLTVSSCLPYILLLSS